MLHYCKDNKLQPLLLLLLYSRKYIPEKYTCSITEKIRARGTFGEKKRKALVWMENKRETELMTFYNKNIKAYLAADG